METKFKTKEIVHNFPAMYQHSTSDLIVLFTGPTTGTVVQETDTSEKLGFHNSNWFNCTNSTYWKKLNPEDIVELIQT